MGGLKGLARVIHHERGRKWRYGMRRGAQAWKMCKSLNVCKLKANMPRLMAYSQFIHSDEIYEIECEKHDEFSLK